MDYFEKSGALVESLISFRAAPCTTNRSVERTDIISILKNRLEIAIVPSLWPVVFTSILMPFSLFHLKYLVLNLKRVAILTIFRTLKEYGGWVHF
jgi:hypothetical protein